jgi:hypothetical protein
MVGYNSNDEAHWRAIIDRAAPALAEACKKWGIPARWLSASEMTDGRSKGFVTHDDARRVWGHTDHDDPGPNFPRSYAAAKVAEAMGVIQGNPPVVVGTTWENLAEDGQLGPHTIRRWQQYMGTPQDGVITQPPGHSSLVVAVQNYLNHKINAGLRVDGQGIAQNGHVYNTVRALQRYLGTTQDGKLSSPVSQAVRALQRRLNNNAF